MIRILQKSIFALAFCGAALCCFAASAKPYMNADVLPNALNFYPAPPETTSVQFMYDISQYMWGKAMRARRKPTWTQWSECSASPSAWRFLQKRLPPS